MSGRKAKAARKALREPGEKDYKEPKRPTGRYLTRQERDQKRAAAKRAAAKHDALLNGLVQSLQKGRS
jgi:hypothetical protein